MWPFPSISLPGSIQKRLVRFLLKRTLGSFLRLSDMDLDMDVSLNALVLRDVSIDVLALNRSLAHFPVHFTTGTLGSISVSVPWLDLAKSSCLITLDHVHLQLHLVPPAPADDFALHEPDLTSSIYMANEFLRRANPDLVSPSTNTSPTEPPSSPEPDLSSGLEGVQMLAGLIDTIIANLSLSITNLTVVLAPLPPSDSCSHQLCPLHVSIPSITIDPITLSFFESYKTAHIPTLYINLLDPPDLQINNDPGVQPLASISHPITIDLALPSSPTPSDMVARVDFPDLLVHANTEHLAHMLAWFQTLNIPTPSAPHSCHKNVSWSRTRLIDPTVTNNTREIPAGTYKQPYTTADSDESDFDADGDDLKSAQFVSAFSSRPGAQMSGTLFHSANLNDSVVVASAHTNGIEISLHLVSVTLTDPSQQCKWCFTLTDLVFSLDTRSLAQPSRTSWKSGPLGVSLSGATLMHLPDGISGNAADRSLVIPNLVVAIDACSLGKANATATLVMVRVNQLMVSSPITSNSLEFSLEHMEAQVSGLLGPSNPTHVTVSLGHVHVNPTSRSATVRQFHVQIEHPNKAVPDSPVSKIRSSESTSVKWTSDFRDAEVQFGAIDACLLRVDYLAMASLPSTDQGRAPFSPFTSRIYSPHFSLALPELGVKMSLVCGSLDFRYLLLVRMEVSRWSVACEPDQRPILESVLSLPPSSQFVYKLLDADKNTSEMYLRHFLVTVSSYSDVEAIQSITDFFDTPPPPCNSPLSPLITTTQVSIRDSALRFAPDCAHHNSADVEIGRADLNARTHFGDSGMLVTGTVHSFNICVDGLFVMAAEVPKFAVMWQQIPSALGLDNQQLDRRLKITVDQPVVTVEGTPLALASVVLIYREAVGIFQKRAHTSTPHSPAYATFFDNSLDPNTSQDSTINVLETVDPVAFKIQPPSSSGQVDMERMSISIVEDFAALESELDQLVVIESSEAMTESSSGSDIESSVSQSSGSSSVVGLDVIDDHFAEMDEWNENNEGPIWDAWSKISPHARSGPVEWTWRLIVNGLSGSLTFLHAQCIAGASNSSDLSPKPQPIIVLEIKDTQFDYLVWAMGHPAGIRDKVTLTIGSLEVRDLVPSSPWNKMVTSARSMARQTEPAHANEPIHGARIPGGTALPFVRMDATCVNGPNSQLGGEWRVKVHVVPIKMHIYQQTIDLVVDFVTSIAAKVIDDSEEPVLVDAVLSPFTPKVTPGHLELESNLFFQRVEVHPITLRIDYKPKSVNIPALQRGQVMELLNMFHLEGAEMTLRHVIIVAVQGWSELISALVSKWVPHVRNTQLPGMVSGVGPLRSLVNIGTGVADLFVLPVEQYKRDGRLVKGLKRGAHNFVRTAAVETLSLGAKLAVGTHSLLEQADHLVGRQSPLMESHSGGSPALPRVSKYAKQPRDTRDGLEQAIRTLSINVTQAARVIAIPVETMERDGATGAMKAVLRAVPIAVLKPMLGATDAVSKTLMGIRNDLDPERRFEAKDKYK